MPEEVLQQQMVFTPTDILNIVKEHLKTGNTPVVIEGVYQMVGTKAYNGGLIWYDQLKSQYDNSQLKVMIPTGIRDQIQGGEVVQLSGTISKSLNDYDGKIELMLRVSGLIGKPVDSLIEAILHGEERQPKIALVYAEGSITDADFRAGVQAASGATSPSNLFVIDTVAPASALVLTSI